jgi:exodeoxyribonuclease VII small subunit
MKKKELTYTEAVAELDEILRYLETNDEINMELIGEKVKRAGELIAFCRKQLTVMDSELEKIIDSLEG